MLNDAGTIRAIAESLHRFTPYYKYIVLDPVMVSTSGCKLIEDDAIEALTSLLMPLATLITPNLSEAEVLTGKRIATIPDMEKSRKRIARLRKPGGPGQRRTPERGGDVRRAIYKRRRPASPVFFAQNRKPQHARHRMHSFLCHCHVSCLGKTLGRSGPESQGIRLSRYLVGKRRAYRGRARTAEPFLCAGASKGK